MRSTKRLRPSPAMIVAILALIAAIGGTAFAASGLTGKEKRQTRNIAKQQVNRLASGLSVAKAKQATNADSATSAANAGQLEGSSLADVAPGASGAMGSCVLSGAFQTCASFDLTLNRTADVLVVATAQWFSGDAAATSERGHCMITRGAASTANIDFGTTSNDTDANQPQSYAISHLFGDVPAGTSTYQLRCLQDEGNITLTLPRLLGFVVT